MTNLLSDYGLVDAKIRASDVDLPGHRCLDSKDDQGIQVSG